MRNLKKSIFIFLILLMVAFINTSLINAENDSSDLFKGLGPEPEYGIGLEVEKPEIYVNILKNIRGDNKININEDLIRSKIELKLRQNDIKVLNKKELQDKDYYLSVYIQRVEDKILSSYTIHLFFIRVVEYTSNDKNYKKDAIVWQDGSFGRGTREDIINGIEENTDIFINEFHKANDF
ncbi:MAG: hypothetical protein ACOC1K_04760 [Nanoarchaeota archaeon]